MQTRQVKQKYYLEIAHASILTLSAASPYSAVWLGHFIFPSLMSLVSNVVGQLRLTKEVWSYAHRTEWREAPSRCCRLCGDSYAYSDWRN